MNKCKFCTMLNAACQACAAIQQMASNPMPKVLTAGNATVMDALVRARKRMCLTLMVPEISVEEWLAGPTGWWTVFMPPHEDIQYVGYTPYGSDDVYMLKWLGVKEVATMMAGQQQTPIELQLVQPPVGSMPNLGSISGTVRSDDSNTLTMNDPDFLPGTFK